MVGQHYYTRERKSLFSHDPGYGSIAKSEDLSDSFIRNVLEKYCRYDTPTLRGVDINDEQNYPNVYIFYFPDGFNNCMVVGNGVYKSKDYTGERSTFFFHNLVLDQDDAHKLMRSKAPALIDRNVFSNGYGVEPCERLPLLKIDDVLQKEELHYSVINDLNLDSSFFKKIVYALLVREKANRKIYISIDVDLKALTEISRTLLSYILNTIPYKIRDLGFLSYSLEPVAYKGINVVVVEKSRLRFTDKTIENDFIFTIGKNAGKNGYESNINEKDLEEYSDFLDFLILGINLDSNILEYFKIADFLIGDKKINLLDAYFDIYKFYKYMVDSNKPLMCNPIYMLELMLGYRKIAEGTPLGIDIDKNLVCFLSDRLAEYKNGKQLLEKQIILLIADSYKEFSTDIGADFRIKTDLEKSAVDFIYNCLTILYNTNLKNTNDRAFVEQFLFAENEFYDLRERIITDVGATLFNAYYTAEFESLTASTLIKLIKEAINLNDSIKPNDLEIFFEEKLNKYVESKSIDELDKIYDLICEEIKSEIWKDYFYHKFIVPELKEKFYDFNPNSYKTLKTAFSLTEKHLPLKETTKASIIKNIMVIFSMNHEKVVSSLLDKSNFLDKSRKNTIAELQKILTNIIINDKTINFEYIYICSLDSGALDYSKSIEIITAISDKTNDILGYFEWLIKNHKKDTLSVAFRGALKEFLTSNWKYYKSNKNKFQDLKRKLKDYSKLDTIINEVKNENMPKWQRFIGGNIRKVFINLSFVTVFAVLSVAIITALNKLLANTNEAPLLVLFVLIELIAITLCCLLIYLKGAAHENTRNKKISKYNNRKHRKSNYRKTR